MSAVTSKDLAVLINENWIGKAEFSNAFRQNRDLLRRMSPGVAGIGSDRIDGYAFSFGIFHQSQNASGLIGCQPPSIACAFDLNAPRTTGLHTHIDLLSKAVDGMRRRITATAG